MQSATFQDNATSNINRNNKTKKYNMMKRLFLITIIIFATLTSCIIVNVKGDGFTSSEKPTENITEKKQMTEFAKLDISVPAHVEVIQTEDSAFCIKMQGPGNYLSEVKTYVKDGTLVMESQKRSIRWESKSNVNVTIYMPKLTSVEMSGAVSGHISRLNVGDISIDGSGASNIKIDSLVANNIKIDLSGASSMRASGTAGYASFDCSGASSLNMYGLVVVNADVDCSGASKLNCNVSKSIKGECSGASSLHYSGNPDKVIVDCSGASSVKHNDNK